MQIDTGAHVSCIGKVLWEKIGKPNLEMEKPLIGYTNNPIPVLGRAMVEVIKGDIKNCFLIVTKSDDIPLLGRHWMAELGMSISVNSITSINSNPCNDLNNLLSNYNAIFDGNNRGIVGHTAQVVLNCEAVPKVHRPRSAPFALLPLIEEEIERLVKLDHIEEIDPS